MKVGEIMTRDVLSVNTKTTLREAVRLMNDRNISGLPVVDNDGKLRGIVSESDVIRLKRKLHMPDYIQLLENMLNNAHPEEFAAEIKRALDMPVSEFMTKNVVTVTESASLAEVTRLLVERGINRLPVVREGKVVGIVTRRDVIRTLAAMNGTQKEEKQNQK